MYGNRLRELRISLGYTQKQLADRLGISAESVSMYELGKRRPQKETNIYHWDNSKNAALNHLSPKNAA